MDKKDSRSGKIVLVSHCLLNVHSLEEGLAEYPGCEEELIEILVKSGVGIFQLPCPEMEISHITRAPLPKDSYDNPVIREKYRKLALEISSKISQFVEKGQYCFYCCWKSLYCFVVSAYNWKPYEAMGAVLQAL